MKIVFTGLAYFGSKLVEELKEFDSNNKYVFCDTYSSKLDQIKFLFHAINADLIISFNGVSSKSKALDYAIMIRKKMILQWHGSDVLNITKNKKKGVFTDKYINYSKSFTDAPWLQTELMYLGIPCQILHFKHVNPDVSSKTFQRLEVLTYMGQDKEKFYGLESIIKLANANKDIIFNVIGTDGNGIQSPENIIFLGWKSQMEVKQYLDKCPIYIRLTDHDGYSLSVLEAVANGNYVLWNYPHPNCSIVSNQNDLISKFDDIKNLVETNMLRKLEENIEWGKQNLNKSLVLSKYIEKIKNIAK